MAEKWEVVEFEKGDPRFKIPEYETHISHVLLFMFGILTASSQIAMTLKILPKSFWPLPAGAFLAGLTCYVWIYYAMEHR